MPAEGIPGYLKYRVLDQNTGAVVIPDLPHPHQSSWTIRAPLPGFAAQAAIGDFRIPLYGPTSKEEFGRYKELYLKLAVGQKVEGFLGDVITGSPRFSGVITKPRRSLTAAWEIAGSDSLYWLQQSQLFPGEQLNSAVSTLNNLRAYLGTREVVWDDDFASGSLANYTNSNFTTGTSDPYFGLPHVTAGAVTAAIISNTTWTHNLQFQNCSISVQGTMVLPSAGFSAIQVVFVSDATVQNSILGECSIDSTGAITLKIFSESAGVFTQQAIASAPLGPVASPFAFEFTAILTSAGGLGQHTVRLLLNGKDANCVWSSAAAFPASGGVGIRWVGGTSSTVYVNRLQFHSRTSGFGGGFGIGGNRWGTDRFQQGTQSAATKNVQQTTSGTIATHLDVLMQAAALEGFLIRKNPGFGFKADTIDFAASPGVDRSSQIVFEENVNVDDAEVGPVGEVYSTDVRINAVPGTDSGGSVTWGRIGAAGDLVLIDTVADVSVPNFNLLVAFAEMVQQRKANPMVATQLSVARTADTADNWRELDFVQVHLPTLNVHHQKQQVVGYTFTEGDAKQTVYLGQFPERALAPVLVKQAPRVLDWLSAFFQAR